MWKKGLALVSVLAFAALGYLLLQGELMPEAQDEPVAQEEASPRPSEAIAEIDRPYRALPEPTQAERPTPVDLPPLAESDPFIREQLERFGLPREWVAREDLMRRLAVLIDNATRGDLPPHRQLRFLKPAGRFEVVERDGALHADPANSRRFDPHLDLLERIEPATAARFLDTIDPLLDAAFRELGSAMSGGEALRVAIERVIEMRAVPADPELVRPKVLYEYADPELESLPPLEKQMLRLGSRNLERLRTYLIALRAELGSAE